MYTEKTFWIKKKINCDWNSLCYKQLFERVVKYIKGNLY